MRKTLFLLLFTCTLLSACTCRNNKVTTEPVSVSKSLFHNRDSLLHYASLAYENEDPKGLYVTGAAAYLQIQDPEAFDTLGLTTVSIEEADILLLRAAELGNDDARKLIKCLAKEGCWVHSVPETK